jgi:hypothetical protein
MSAKWTDPPRRNQGNVDLRKTNARKLRTRQGRRWFRADLRDWLSTHGWR